MRLLASLILFFCTSAHAMLIEPKLENPHQEQTAQALFHELKCVVCEGQSLAESNADFAVDMRAQVRRLVRDGNSAAQVRDYFSTRYGEQILLNPPLNPRTWLLWFGPLLLVLLGGFILWRHTRHHGASS